MYAIVQQGSKQFQVEKGKAYQFDRLPNASGDKVSFKEVLLVVDKSKRHIGTPFVKGAEVRGKVVTEVKGKKVISFKFKRRKSSKKIKGHRQRYTLVEIEDIKV